MPASKSKSCSGGERKYGTYPERNRQFVEQIGNPKVTPTLIFNLKSSRNDTKQMNNKDNSFFFLFININFNHGIKGE